MFNFTAAYVFLLVILIASFVKIWLAIRQIKYVSHHRNTVPMAFKEKVSLKAHQLAADYTVALTRLTTVEGLFSVFLLIMLTWGGGIALIDQLFLHRFGDSLIQQLLLILAISGIAIIVSLPFEYIRHFVVEERFGFNKMTRKLFIFDQIKSGILGIMIGAPLLACILWLINSAGQAWWFYAWIVWVVFNSVILIIYPTCIAPMFNRFEPLNDHALKERIEGLLQRCGFISKGLFIMDGSRRSSHGNAYFTGFGTAKRIVFFDTLIKNLNIDEIEAVLAHELGHFKHKHILKRLLSSFIISFIFMALLGFLINQPWFYAALNLNRSIAMPANAAGGSAALALLAFSFAIPYFTFILKPIASLISRKHEFEADSFAAKQVPAQKLIDALIKLYNENASTLTPDPIYTIFYYSHPPADQRIQHLTHQSL